MRPSDTSPRFPRGSLPLLAIVLLSCEFHETTRVTLPTLEGARSVIVGVESEDEIAVSVIDLEATTFVDLPHLRADARSLMRASARFYFEPLATLAVPEGPLAFSQDGNPIPKGATENNDRLREFQNDDDTDWLTGRLGVRFESFRSDLLPRPSQCRAFKTETTLPLDGTFRVVGAAALGDGALILQVASGPSGIEGTHLYHLQETELTALHSTQPNLLLPFANGIGLLSSFADGVLLSGCAAGVPKLSFVDATLNASEWPTEGLSGCASALSAFGARLFALVGWTDVFAFDEGTRTWRALPSFPHRVRQTARNTGFAFVALGPDRVLGVSSSSIGPIRIEHQSMLIEGGQVTVSPLPLSDTTQFDISQPALVDDQLVLVFGDSTIGSFFLSRSPEGAWRAEGPVESQIIYALSAWDDALWATGRFGFLLEAHIDGLERTEFCTSETIAAGSYSTVVLPLPQSRFLLAGDVNFQLERDDPNRKVQTISIATLR